MLLGAVPGLAALLVAGLSHAVDAGQPPYRDAGPPNRLLGLCQDLASPRSARRSHRPKCPNGSCQGASVAPARARNGILLARTGDIARDYDASAKGRRQQGHSPSCPFTRVKNAVGCGKVMIALIARATGQHRRGPALLGGLSPR